MRLTISKARPQLGRLVTRAQDPREMIILTRHGNDVGAIVSFEEVQHIWRLQDIEWEGNVRHPLFPVMWGRKSRERAGRFEMGKDGKLVSVFEAAEQMREVQMSRAEERRILKRGGLEPVEGGELGEEGKVGRRKRRGLLAWCMKSRTLR